MIRLYAKFTVGAGLAQLVGARYIVPLQRDNAACASRVHQQTGEKDTIDSTTPTSGPIAAKRPPDRGIRLYRPRGPSSSADVV